MVKEDCETGIDASNIPGRTWMSLKVAERGRFVDSSFIQRSADRC